MGLLLIVVMPIVAAMHYFLVIEKPPRESGQSVAIYVMTLLIGTFALLSYHGLMLALSWSMLRR
jgi:bacteriorhodopsin